MIVNNQLTNLNKMIVAQCDPEAGEWFEQVLKSLEEKNTIENDLPLFLAQARRKVGVQKLAAASLETDIGHVDLNGCELGDGARIAFIIKALIAYDENERAALIERLYRMGDEGERAAITHGLALFGIGEGLKPIALMTARTNSIALYSSLAHGNPFPAAYFSLAEFNQLILKSLFIGISIELIGGLEARANLKLSSMCEDYIDERLNADRSIPVDIWLALLPYASERGKLMALEALDHADPAHRYYASLAISRCLVQRPEWALVLEKRLQQEEVSEVVTLLQQVLSV